MKIRTSVFRGMALLSLMTLGLAACEDKTTTVITPPPVAIILTPTEVTLDVGQTASLVAIVQNSTNQAVSYSSSNNAVATVSPAGVVAAVSPGSATITATSAADATAKAVAFVTVRQRVVNISLAPSAATIPVGGTVQLAGSVSGSGISNFGVTFRSLSSAVTVSATGLVTGVAPGTAVVQAIAQADTTVRANSVITVSAPAPVTVSISPSAASAQVGATVQFTPQVTGSTNTAVTFSSSSPSVATVNASGLATAVAPGSTTITVTSVADPTKSSTAVLTVTQVVNAVTVTLTPQNATILTGQQAAFSASVSGSSNQAVTYSISPTSVATVDANGVVTGIAPGQAILTATSVASPSSRATATVTVQQNPATVVNVSVAPSSASATAGGSAVQLVSTVTGTNNTAVTCSTSDANVATVVVSTQGCTVTPVGAGTAVITIRSVADPTKSAQSVITVSTSSPVGITLSPSTASCSIGTTVNFVATVSGSSNVGANFSSSDANVATVNPASSTSGSTTVTCVGAGTAVIRAASAADPSKVATATLTVSAAPPVGITVSPTTANVGVGASTPVIATVTGSSNQNVTCSSANTSIATVVVTADNRGCVISGAGAGNTVVTVTSVADPTKSANVPVTVVGASVAISTTTAAAPPATTAGGFTVSANVSVPAGTADSLIIRLTNATTGATFDVFCQQFTSAGAATTIICPINPADTDPRVAGAQTLPDGTYTISARLLRNNVLAAQATFGQQVITANPNNVGIAVSFTNVDGPVSASDPQGRTWNGGDVNVTVTQQNFTPPAAATLNINFDLNCDGVVDATAANVAPNAAGQFTATFPENVVLPAGVGSVSDLGACVTVSNARNSTSGAVALVGTTSALFNLDNLTPTLAAPVLSPAVVANNNFLGRDFVFNNANFGITTAPAGNTFDRQQDLVTACYGTAPADQCVNIVTVTMFAGLESEYQAGGTTAASRNAAFVTAARNVTGVATQNTTLTSNANNALYRLVAVATDALGNRTIVAGPTFGVDITNPTIVSMTTPQQINPLTDPPGAPTTTITVVVADDAAGSGPDQVTVRITGYSILEYNGDTAQEISCFDATGARTGLAPASGICPTFTLALAPVGGGSTNGTATITLPGAADENLFVVEAAGRDNAGNVGAFTTRTYEQDEQAPTITTTATTVAGNSISVTGDITDNVELQAYDARFNFTGLNAAAGNGASPNLDQVPFALPTTVGAFGLPLSAVVTGVTATNTPRIRELDVDNLGAGAPILPNSFGFAATDLGNNYTFGANAYAAAGGDGIAGVRAGGTGFVLSRTNATICRTGTAPPCTSSTTPTSTTLSARLETDPTVNTNPFATVYFYYSNPGDDNTVGTADDFWTLFAQTNGSDAAIATGVNNRTFTNTAVTLTAASLPRAGTPYLLMAIGVDAQGDAMAAFNTLTVQ